MAGRFLIHDTASTDDLLERKRSGEEVSASLFPVVDPTPIHLMERRQVNEYGIMCHVTSHESHGSCMHGYESRIT